MISGIVKVNHRFPIVCPSYLIHEQIRAEWVPAARSCAIINVEICRDFYINLLVTDVILLFIMLAGLLRLRRDTGSFYLSQLLWKQVGPRWFLLVAMFVLQHLAFFRVSSGSLLPPPQKFRKW